MARNTAKWMDMKSRDAELGEYSEKGAPRCRVYEEFIVHTLMSRFKDNSSVKILSSDYNQDTKEGTDFFVLLADYPRPIRCDFTFGFDEKDNMPFVSNYTMDFVDMPNRRSHSIQFGVRTGNARKAFDEPVIVVGLNMTPDEIHTEAWDAYDAGWGNGWNDHRYREHGMYPPIDHIDRVINSKVVQKDHENHPYVKVLNKDGTTSFAAISRYGTSAFITDSDTHRKLLDNYGDEIYRELNSDEQLIRAIESTYLSAIAVHDTLTTNADVMKSLRQNKKGAKFADNSRSTSDMNELLKEIPDSDLKLNRKANKDDIPELIKDFTNSELPSSEAVYGDD